MTVSSAVAAPVLREEEDDSFASSVSEGLSRTLKTLEPKWFYDATGSRLFEDICKTDDYYVTRTELGILLRVAREIVSIIGPDVTLFEPGAGSSLKTHAILDQLEWPSAYVPADIAAAHLAAVAQGLRKRYPNLRICPVPLDFTRSVQLPQALRTAAPVTIFFPGSTIGNFEPPAAQKLLRRFRQEGHARFLVVGVDLVKDSARLHAAYNDRDGATAAFNLNLLARINRELGADFDLNRFRHLAEYNEAEQRIEMYLESSGDQRVHVLGREILFSNGERILTELSYKYTAKGFYNLARSAGWRDPVCWTDDKQLFAVWLFRSA